MQTVQDIKPETLTTYGAVRQACQVIRKAATDNSAVIFDYTKANKHTMNHEGAATLHTKAYMEFHYNEVDCIGYLEDTREWQAEEGIKDDDVISREINIQYWQKAVKDELEIYNNAKKVMDEYIK